jgi:hypothetical protein
MFESTLVFLTDDVKPNCQPGTAIEACHPSTGNIYACMIAAND